MFVEKLKNKIKNIIVLNNFDGVATEWLNYKKNSVKYSTYCNYKYIVENYLMPEFRKKDIRKLTDFNDFITGLSDRLSPKTVRDITSVLKAILNYYENEKEKKLKYKKMSVPRVEKKKIRVLTYKEKMRLQKKCIDDNSLPSLGIVMALNTGMRIGEVCALKWDDMDLGAKCIHINHTAQRVYRGKGIRTQVMVSTPKTQCSVRTIPINKKLYRIMSPLKKKYSPNCFVLTGKEDVCMDPQRYEVLFQKKLKENKIRKCGFHTLRHTFSTNCVEVGMDIKALSEILGHSSVSITLDIYVHSSYKVKKKFLEKL